MNHVAQSEPAAPLMLSVSGCRGIFGRTMTPEVAARFGMVAGAWFVERAHAHGTKAPLPPRRASGPSPAEAGEGFGKPLVILGRDGRAGGEILAAAAASGLAASGCDVLDCCVAMTPTIGVMVDVRGAAGGLVVTASHNPQEWNGLKAVGSGKWEVGSGKSEPVAASAPGKSDADALIARYRAAEKGGAVGVGVEGVGRIEKCATGAALGLPGEATHMHVERVREALKAIGCIEDRRWQSVRCVVDSVNASGTSGAKALLGPCIAHHLGSSDSGLFPHAPEPTRENLATLARFTAEKRADVGFAQDPDADRMAIIDEKGNYIGEEYTLVLAAEALLGSGKVTEWQSGKAAAAHSATLPLSHSATPTPPTICTNLSTSRMIEDVAAKYGARVIRTPVGEAHVVEAMKKYGAVLGGEGNGGVIWPRVTYIRDSLSAMGLVLALMTRTGKKVSELVAEIPAYAIVKRKVDLRSPEDARRAVEAVARAFASEKIDRQDGVRVDFASRRAWLHVRGSNTEPIMRLIAEAPTEGVANEILDEAARVISA